MDRIFIFFILVVFGCGEESTTSPPSLVTIDLTYDHLQGEWVNDVGNVYRFTGADSTHQVEWRFYRGVESDGFWGEYWIDGEYIAMKGYDAVFHTTKVLRYPNIHTFDVSSDTTKLVNTLIYTKM